MSGGWLLTDVIAALLLPPLGLVLPAAAGILLRRRWPRGGLALALLSLASLIVLSTAACARLLLHPLEDMYPPLADTVQAQAIVILGGGRQRNAPEYENHDVPYSGSLARLRYGAHLQRRTGLPLLVTGGRPGGGAESEAQLMAQVLREDFFVPVRWVENDSDNTAQNALYSAIQLRQDGIRHILLVTDAVHMPRAYQMFTQTGLQVSAAPTNYLARGPLKAIHFVPNAVALRDSSYALHEWLGLLWYRLRHGSDGTASEA